MQSDEQIIYWENGRKKRSVQFQEGIRSGMDQMWNEEGILVDEGRYEMGKPVGLHRRWNKKGVLVEEISYQEGKPSFVRKWNEEGVPYKEGNVEEASEPDTYSKALDLLMEHFPKLGFMAPTWTPIETPFEALESMDVGNAEGVYVYGLGNGVPYQQLKTWLHADAKRKLIFLEDEPGRIAFFLQKPESILLLSDPQVYMELIEPKRPDLFEIAGKHPIERIEIFSLPSKNKKRFAFLKQELFRKTTHSFGIHLDRILGYRLFGNFVQNLRHLPRSFYANQWKGAFTGIPAIVCGAGPSLNDAIPLLKTLSDRALIIAGGSTLAALSSQGVPIHFGMAIDPNLEEYNRLKNSFAFDTPLLYSTRVHPEVFQTCNGPFGYMRSGIGGVLEVWLEEELGLLEPLIGADLSYESMSVTTICTAWAEFLGCNTILFSGVDLAYANQKRYAEGVGVDADISLTLLDAEKNSYDRIFLQKDASGNPVYTATRWLMEAASLTDYAKKHKKTRFINTSEIGLKIQGMPHMKLNEAADLYLRNTFDLAKMIRDGIARSWMPDSTMQTVAAKREELRLSLSRIVGHLEVLTKEKKGSFALAEVELQEEIAKDLIFHDVFAILEKGRVGKSPLSLEEKWRGFLDLAKYYQQEFAV